MSEPEDAIFAASVSAFGRALTAGPVNDAPQLSVPAARASQPARPRFIGGRRELRREGELPFGLGCPALDARVEVEFSDYIYSGTVVMAAGTSFTVLFDTDGKKVDVTCGQHRFREILQPEPHEAPTPAPAAAAAAAPAAASAAA